MEVGAEAVVARVAADMEQVAHQVIVEVAVGRQGRQQGSAADISAEA